MSNRHKTRLLWFAVPIAACLPCLLPALVVILLTVGGTGAIGSFVTGIGGLVFLVVGSLLIAAGAFIYWRRRLRRRAAPLVLFDN
jgi:hypothetical protein